MVMMSPNGDENFMAKYGMVTTTPRVLTDGRPSKTLYVVSASMMTKRIGIVLVWDPSWKTLWR